MYTLYILIGFIFFIAQVNYFQHICLNCILYFYILTTLLFGSIPTTLKWIYLAVSLDQIPSGYARHCIRLHDFCMLLRIVLVRQESRRVGDLVSSAPLNLAGYLSDHSEHSWIQPGM